MMPIRNLSLSDKVLLAAVALVQGEVSAEFTAEDLVVEAWKRDNASFGLRGHESKHPDNNKVYTKIDGKSGLVSKGWLLKSGERTLRLSHSGLARAAELDSDAEFAHADKLDRALQTAVQQIISHPEFISWLKDPNSPTRFRGAGHFWGIAPGTPAEAVRSRVLGIERTLRAARSILERRGMNEIVEQRGRVLFDRHDLDRALEFQAALRARFRRDLELLDRGYNYAAISGPE